MKILRFLGIMGEIYVILAVEFKIFSNKIFSKRGMPIDIMFNGYNFLHIVYIVCRGEIVSCYDSTKNSITQWTFITRKKL